MTMTFEAAPPQKQHSWLGILGLQLALLPWLYVAAIYILRPG